MVHCFNEKSAAKTIFRSSQVFGDDTAQTVKIRLMVFIGVIPARAKHITSLTQPAARSFATPPSEVHSIDQSGLMAFKIDQIQRRSGPFRTSPDLRAPACRQACTLR